MPHFQSLPITYGRARENIYPLLTDYSGVTELSDLLKFSRKCGLCQNQQTLDNLKNRVILCTIVFGRNYQDCHRI